MLIFLLEISVNKARSLLTMFTIGANKLHCSWLSARSRVANWLVSLVLKIELKPCEFFMATTTKVTIITCSTQLQKTRSCEGLQFINAKQSPWLITLPMSLDMFINSNIHRQSSAEIVKIFTSVG